MPLNIHKFGRFLSEQSHRNYGYLDEEATPRFSTPDAKENSLPQLPAQAEQEAQHVGELLENSIFTGINMIETGLASHREMKEGSQRFRWNLLFNLLVWLIVPLPFWIPFISNRLAYCLLPSIQGVFVLMWLVISVLGMKNALVLYWNRARTFTEECAGLETRRIRHIVTICCYKEAKELIANSIQTLAEQTEVSRVTLVVGFEEKTPAKEGKCRWLQETFRNSGFERMIFTIHPKDQPDEIPGKCSNSNYALRMAVSQMNIDEKEMDTVLVTTCDADSRFPPQYIAALTCRYLQENCPALTTIYQSPLFYNWKLDGLSCVTRVTGLLRSLLMLGALIPFNINTMSIFSFSLSLAKKGNFVHPAYQMDDIICLIRWMGVTRQRLRISMIPVPVLSGPTSGETIETELIEWARQARRWTIGAAEVFHYFVIKSRRMPIRAAGSWGIAFLIYYGILLCTGGLFGLTSMLSMFLLVKDVPPTINYIMYGLLALQMLAFATAFVIDAFIPRLLKVKECICLPRNLFHFISTPFVLLAYSLVELYALHEVVIFGKKVCKHGASNKDNLKV